MHGGIFKKLRGIRVAISLYLLAVILVGSFGDGLIFHPTHIAEAAEATIDPDAHINGTAHLISGSQTVFTDDQTGYKFFRDAPGYCVYRKTTDGGTTWSATTTVDGQADCIQISVWYDRWTPGDTGTIIHIATLDTNPDDVWYNNLDTSSDSLLMGSAPVSTTIGQGGTITEGSNLASITKGTDGTIYVSNIDGSDSYVVECSANCNIAGSWIETGTNPFGLTANYAILAPLPGGDILAIHRDIAAAAEDMGSKVWNNTGGTWDAATTTFDTNAPDNTTYDAGMAFTVSPTTGDIYLAYVAQNAALGNDDQIRTAVYSGGVWTLKKEVVRYSEYGVTNVAIALDVSNDDVYVAYSALTVPTTLASANVYWKKSADGMSTWTYEEGPMNDAPNDIYGVDLNISNRERIYASWFQNTGDDIMGDTIADIHPGIQVTTVSPDGVNDTDAYTMDTIDSDAFITGTSHHISGSQTVFTDDQTGYKFFRDAPGYCVYRKTTDGGTTWSATTTVDAQTDCAMVTVWYDQWTPGDTGTYIHIATFDENPDDVWYNRLDTAGDTLLMGTSPVSVFIGPPAQGGTLTAGSNSISITKATDGTLYASSIDASDSVVLMCTANCNLAASWDEAGTDPFGRTNNYAILAPLSGGDIIAIHRDIGASAENIESKVYDSGTNTWDAASTTIDSDAPDNTTYDIGMAVTVSPTTGDVYLAYIARNATPGSDDQIRTAKYSGGVWTATTDVVASTVSGLTNVAIALDASNDDVYVAYSAQGIANSANTASVLWRKSTDDMASWGFIQGPVNTSPTSIYGMDLNQVSSDRIYATWFGDVTDDVYGATLIDLPSPTIPTLDNQVATVNASTSNVYIGGTFVIYNTDVLNSYNVTGITLTESGSVDASTDIANVKLYYEMDTSSPYTCTSESYDGSESRFGSTDVNGFSGADGVSSFTGSTVSVSDTGTLCVYVVFDVLDTADGDSTIEISIENPGSDIFVTGGTAGPVSSQDIPGTTTIYNDAPTLMHYHWRNDDGDEVNATSKTAGVEDTSLTTMRQGSTTRLRVEVSNEGSSSTPAIQYRLEYAPNPSTCDAATGWVDVGAIGGDFDMSVSGNLNDGDSTTNITVEGNGAVSDENALFHSPNYAVKTTSSETGPIVLTTTEFVEFEYSIVASTTAIEGNTYCFRVSDQGSPLSEYRVYPRANISADILVTVATSSQMVNFTIPTTTQYIGTGFVITENVDSRDVTSITITENGTVNAETGLDNIELRYDLDVTAPYDCAGESYTVGDDQFGSTDTDGFSSLNGTSTFTGSVTVSTTSTLCLYPVLDVTSSAQNGETINIVMENPSMNLTVSVGSVSPTITRDLSGETTLLGAVLTQTHYHWRNDNGDETTATSFTGGNEDSPAANIALTSPVRLRLQVSNEGAVTSGDTALRVEYGTKITTCSDVGSWTDVGALGGAWNMATTSNLTDESDTTNIFGSAEGAVTDENTNFVSPNSAVKELLSTVATTTLSPIQFIEAEFSMKPTVDAGYDITYCFRVSNGGTPLNAYPIYPELTTSPERDFEIQRGTVNFSTNAITLVAGVDYIAPSASTSAFVRITNSHHTGAGDSSAGGNQNADDVTAYILDPSNITTSFTIQRPATAAATTTRVSWEIVEYIGSIGADNEMIVRSQGTIAYTTTSLTATTSVISDIGNDTDVVVFITGVGSPDTGTADYNTMQSTSEWLSASDQAAFTRGEAGSDAVVLSYAVVEFTGLNWAIQRSEHTYSAAGTTETESITAVNSLARTMLHAQKRVGGGLAGIDEFGHEVWLSSIGYVSYFLQTGATTPGNQTSVAWIIENMQTSAGAMDVTYSNGDSLNGAEPFTLSVPIGKTLTDITNASIFVNSRVAGTDGSFPRPIAGATIASSTHYELWRSDTGAQLAYRTIIVEWPTAGLTYRQNYYRLYVDNNALLPLDAWPIGDSALGENEALTGLDEPLGEAETIRIRMSVRAINATFPAETKSWKLQYGQMLTTCSAIDETNWNTLGDMSSSTIWRGADATNLADGTQLVGSPTTTVLSVSDVAGTFEEMNDSAVNAYAVPEGDDIEYDWLIEQNGASAETFYCFRLVESNGTLMGNYANYPQIRTASFTPKTQNWRWYDDVLNETPVSALASENTAPIDFVNGSTTKLRVTVKETENISRDDVRFKLQYSESPNFSTAFDLTASSTCTASSTWCYDDSNGADNVKITTKTLSDADSCVSSVGDGCGTHNLSPLPLTGFRHNRNTAAEYEFTLKSAGPRVNRVYYFRLFDLVQGIPVTTNIGESYPSLVTEGASLDFTMEGIASSTVVEGGITLDINTTPTTLPFGKLVPDGIKEGAHRLTIDTNGTEGYQIFMVMDSELTSGMGATMKPLTSTNAVPAAWTTGCSVSAASCFGYHTSDDTLDGVSTARFLAPDTFARVSTSTLDEVSYSSQPVAGETTDVIYRILIRGLQDAGVYESRIRYVSVPIF